RAATLIFEFGSEEPGTSPADLNLSLRLGEVVAAFHRAVARERERASQGQAARQHFIVVNAINTVFERLVSNHLIFNYTPFTLRLEPKAWQGRVEAIRRGPRNAARIDPCLRVRTNTDRRSPTALSKFADIEDWNRAEWLEQLRLCDEAAQSTNFLQRHRSTWEI